MFSADLVSRLSKTDMTSRRTAVDSRSLDVERNSDRGATATSTAARAARRGHSEARRAPASGNGAAAGLERRDSGRVAPGEVRSRRGVAARLVDLLREAAVRGRVVGDDLEEAVSPVADGGGEGGVFGGGRGVGAGGDGGGELLEEGEGGAGDVEGAELVPGGERVVELLGDGEGGEVPGLVGGSVVVRSPRLSIRTLPL